MKKVNFTTSIEANMKQLLKKPNNPFLSNEEKIMITWILFENFSSALVWRLSKNVLGLSSLV